MSATGTWQTTAPNRSGRWIMTAPTSRPPLLPPSIASRAAACIPRRQPLGGRDEVVEDVLLALEHAGLVPLLAVLAAAAQVGEREARRRASSNRKLRRVERRRQADVEPAVAA